MSLRPNAARTTRDHLRAGLAVLPILLAACGGASPVASPTNAAPASALTGPTAGNPASPTTPAATVAPTSDAIVRPGEAWVAYQWVAGNGDGIFLVRLDGTGQHRIAADAGSSQIHPEWSPDGSQIAFVSIATGDQMRLWVVNADGTGAKQLYGCDAPCAGVENPDWSADGSSIFFGTYTDLDAQGIPATFQIGRYDVASGKTEIALERKDGHTAEQARVSPDGKHLVYTRYTNPAGGGEGSAIFIADVDGKHEQQLTAFKDWGAHPDWSIDNRIVFNTRDLGAFQESGYPANLFVMQPDGSGLTPLTTFDTDPRATQPRWSPDGKQIVFTHVTGSGMGTRTLWVVNADGTGLAELIPSGGFSATHPNLRPLPS